MPFSNGRREGANLFSRVIVLPILESQTFVVDQLCCFKLGISVPNLKTCIPSDRSHPYKKNRWRLHLFLWSSKSWRETVMTAWRLHWGLRELSQYRVICCMSFVICMLSLSVVILFSCRYNARFFFIFIFHPYLHFNNFDFILCVEL